jgi:hypothetical protein
MERPRIAPAGSLSGLALKIYREFRNPDALSELNEAVENIVAAVMATEDWPVKCRSVVREGILRRNGTYPTFAKIRRAQRNSGLWNRSVRAVRKQRFAMLKYPSLRWILGGIPDRRRIDGPDGNSSS